MRLPGEREGRAGQQVAAPRPLSRRPRPVRLPSDVALAPIGPVAVAMPPLPPRPSIPGAHAPATGEPAPRRLYLYVATCTYASRLVRSFRPVRFPFIRSGVFPFVPSKLPESQGFVESPARGAERPQGGRTGGDGREGGGPAAFARHGRGSHRDPHRGPSSRPVSGRVSAGDRTDAAVQLHCIDPHGAGALTQPLGQCPCQQVAGVQHGRVSASLCRLW